ncbi:MAG: HAD family hydrolase, partial [Janthinobacterium lividum]
DAGMATCFAHVFSADLEVSKRTQLRLLAGDRSYANVRRCSESYVETEAVPDGDEVVLVTDTVGDVSEGLAAGARVIGVSWGMHGADRLGRAGASFVARWPQELVAELLPGGSCRTGGCGCEQGTCSTTGTCALRPARVERPYADASQVGAVALRLDRRAAALQHPTTQHATAQYPTTQRATTQYASAEPTPSSPSSRPAALPSRSSDRLTNAIHRISRSPGAPSR